MSLPRFKDWLKKDKEVVKNNEESALNQPKKTLNRLNETTEEELTTIRGIGPKTAKKVLNSVPVSSFDDLNLPSHVVGKLRNYFEDSALQHE